MKQYVGLDVSLKETHICVVDESGTVVARGREATQPELLAAAIRRLAPGCVLAVMETGGQSSWLCSGLREEGVNAVIVDARRAKAVLSCRLNKTDANDAEGLAQLARTGWYREVAAKSEATRRVRALLLARQQVAKQRRDLENQIRGILRGFGLKVGRVGRCGFEARVTALLAGDALLQDAVIPLLTVRRCLLAQLKTVEARLKREAAGSEVSRQLMTAPGVGPMTVMAFMTTIDDPGRFQRSSSVGAYLGLTSRRHQSGDTDWQGRISKHGDALCRHMLYEAANSLLTRVKRMSPLKAWGLRLVKRIGPKKARVAVARKLAVILHRMWVDGSEFRWGCEAAAA